MPGFYVFSAAGERSALVRVPGIRWVDALDWNAASGRIAILAQGENGRGGIWTVGPGGETPRLVYQTDAARGICSAPAAGDVLYVQRNAAGVSDIVRLPLDRMDPIEPEVLLSGLPPGDGCSVSVDGQRMLYTRSLDTSNLWRIDLDRPGSPPVAVTAGTGIFTNPHASPDGEWLSVTRWAANDNLVRMPIAGGPFVPIGPGQDGSWSPDGKHFAFVSDKNGKMQPWVGDADGQHAAPIPTEQLSNQMMTWFPDGRLAWQTADARDFIIHDLQTGKEEHLLPPNAPGWVFFPHVSPTGRTVAVFWNRPPTRGLWSLTWPAREDRFVLKNARPFGWSADSRFVYALESSEGRFDRNTSIVRVNIDTGRVDQIARPPKGLFSTCTLVAKRPIAICAVLEESSDAWLVEHFDPHIIPQKK
jgi:dipeptidyl aminopeptidase/acylaminoacyl peptidase